MGNIIDGNDAPVWLTVGEAAVILRVSKKSVYASIREGQIPARKIGKWLRIASSVISAPTLKDSKGAP